MKYEFLISDGEAAASRGTDVDNFFEVTTEADSLEEAVRNIWPNLYTENFEDWADEYFEDEEDLEDFHALDYIEEYTDISGGDPWIEGIKENGKFISPAFEDTIIGGKIDADVARRWFDKEIADEIINAQKAPEFIVYGLDDDGDVVEEIARFKNEEDAKRFAAAQDVATKVESDEEKLDEDTHAQYAKPEGNRIAAYNNALRYAKEENTPFIYGYTNHTGKFFALDQPVKGADEHAFKNRYKDCNTIYVAYPDKRFIEEDIEELIESFKDPLDLEDVVIDSWNHLYYDLGETPTVTDILVDVAESYDGFNNLDHDDTYDAVFDILVNNDLEFDDKD